MSEDITFENEAHLAEVPEKMTGRRRAHRVRAARKVMETGEEDFDMPRYVLAEMRAALRETEHRLHGLEKALERSLRERPGPWMLGSIGLIGLGVALAVAWRRLEH